MRNSSDGDERELFPLSWLAQYGYCPHRCGLLALNGLWRENEYTASGRVGHQRVHAARTERRGDRIQLFELPVFSRVLGVSGRCDCVEADKAAVGVPLPYGEGRYALYPVEYKHGVVRDEEEYHLQLCAQAMCLEERFGAELPRGAIFYIDAHRRDEVELSSELREKVRQTARAVAEMIDGEKLPPPEYGPKCRKCSMAEVCQPKASPSAQRYLRGLWASVTEEGAP